jgi:CubicO group peptidase (beta-lactamase class C family)
MTPGCGAGSERGGAAGHRGARWGLTVCLCVVIAVLAAARPAPAAELSEQAARWASDVGFVGSLELRQGSQLLARVDRPGNDAPVEPGAAASVFWIGSISKQFAAVAILRLVERGRLGLGEPISRYFPELAAPALSKGGVSCSIEHLLSHGCGLPRALSWDSLHTARHLSDPERAARLIEQLARTPLMFEPGTKYSYSNAGYALLGLLIQHATGQSYESFLQAELWGPLGMRATGIAPRAGVTPVRGQLRLGPLWLDSLRWMLLDPWTPSTVGAGGAIYSTLDDLLLWNDALHHGRVLAPESYRAMTTPRHGDYGFGLVITKKPFGTLISHAGSHSPQSVSALLQYVPELDLSLAGGSSRSYEDSGLKPLGEALLARAAHAPGVPAPRASGWVEVLLSSLLALLQIAVVGYALGTSWICFFRRAQFDGLRWWLRYHTAWLALLAYSLRWRDTAFDPLVVGWALGCLGVAWASRWWLLPAWPRELGLRTLSGLLARVLSFAVVLYFLPLRYLSVAVAVLAVELVPLALRRLRRAQRAPAVPLSAAR